jgi:hypothetical protein
MTWTSPLVRNHTSTSSAWRKQVSRRVPLTGAAGSALGAQQRGQLGDQFTGDVGEVGQRARCRCFHRSFPAGPLPNPAYRSPGTGLSTCLGPVVSRWGRLPVSGSTGWGSATAVAVAGHRDAGGAGEHHPVVGESPSAVAEATAHVLQRQSSSTLVFCPYPAHQPTPGMVVDRAERGLGHPVSEVVRPPAKVLFRLRISSSRSMWRVDLYVFADTLPLIA